MSTIATATGSRVIDDSRKTPKKDQASVRHPLDDSELRRRALERWENEGGRRPSSD